MNLSKYPGQGPLQAADKRHCKAFFLYIATMQVQNNTVLCETY